MRILVLGGTHHVGRAIVESALARGDDVTTHSPAARADPRPPEPRPATPIAPTLLPLQQP